MIKKIIITILLSLMLIFTFSSIIYANILTKNDVIEVIDDINYYDIINEDLTKKLANSLPNDELAYVYTKYVNLDTIKKDISFLLDNYDHNIYDYSEVKKRFYQNVINELSDYDQNNQNVIELANDLSNIYANNILPTKQLSKISDKLPFKEISENIAILTLLITILTLLICIFLTKQNYIYNSMLTTGILFIIPTIFIKFNNFVSNLYYYSNSFSIFIKNYFYSVINNYFIIGSILIVLALIGNVLTYIYRKKIDLNN